MKIIAGFAKNILTKSMSILLSFIMVLSVLVFTDTEVLAASSTATVNDGVYTLSSKASGFMMNVYGGKDANRTKVTTWKFDGTVDQRINVKHIGNGKYRLYAMCSSNGSNRVIDVYRGNSAVSTGQYIDIWSPNDSSAQEFYINPQGDGSFTIELASLSGNVLSCTNASSNGAQLQLQKFTGTDSQKWYFNNTSGVKVDPTIKDSSSTSTASAAVNDGVYKISSKASGFMMNVYGGKDANHTKVTTWKSDGTADQSIKVKHIGNGKYLLYAMCSSKGSNRVIDVYRGKSAVRTGQYIDIWSQNDNSAQEFYIKPQGDGSFTIELASLPGNVLSCTNASSNGAQLQLQKFTGADSQKWCFNKVTDGTGSSGKFMWPVDMSKAVITQTFAQHTIADKGLDIGSYGHANLPIYAADAGKVITSAYGAYGEGNYIKIDHGNGKITIYEHLKSRDVKVGQQVSKGQQIGLMGTTGNSTGVHLHFGLVVNGTKVDPKSYLP